MQNRRRRRTELANLVEVLRPLHAPLEAPRPGDWLDEMSESGERFAEYLCGKPVTATGARRFIDVQPLGHMTPTQSRLVADTADLIAAFFCLPVRVLEGLPLDVVPKRHRRNHPQWGDLQIRSGFVLERLLLPRLAGDAAACIGFTPVDLWPGSGWNFVFGEASLEDRVAVWSTYRKGDPAKGAQRYRRVLRRTAQTAIHEIGHMFSMDHCVAYECVMCASNTIEEGDRRPLNACCECVAKVLWATGAAPRPRFERMRALCRRHGLSREAALYRRSVTALAG